VITTPPPRPETPGFSLIPPTTLSGDAHSCEPPQQSGSSRRYLNRVGLKLIMERLISIVERGGAASHPCGLGDTPPVAFIHPFLARGLRRFSFDFGVSVAIRHAVFYHIFFHFRGRYCPFDDCNIPNRLGYCKGYFQYLFALFLARWHTVCYTCCQGIVALNYDGVFIFSFRFSSLVVIPIFRIPARLAKGFATPLIS